jgi:signal transduction histidine kinase/streptogramin lyase
VESLYADREGSIWDGLGRLGLARFATAASPFQRFSRLDRPDSTVQPFVGAIYEDREGILWIGTPAALNRIDRKGRHRYYRRTTTRGAANVDAVSIVEDHSGTLWVGTYGHGLLRFDRRTGRFTTYQHDQADRHSLSSNTVMRLLVDHDGRLWAATAEGLNRLDAATNRFTTYRLGPGRNDFLLELVEDRAGVLWVGSMFSGLFRFDPDTGIVTGYEHDRTRPGTLSDNRINSLHFDRSGTLWVGTQSGLNRFESQTGRFTTYTRRDGLPGSTIGAILDDEEGNFWIGTNNGLAKFNPQSRTVKTYATPDGLPGSDLTGWGTGFKAPNGRMYFGGFGGATAFFPDQVTDVSYIPPIVLTDVHLSGIPAEIGSRTLPRSISSIGHITLFHDQNILSLTFAALSYANAATNRYRYKLEGLQSAWTEVGSDQRQATYTTLPAGTYTFRVQGATSRGAWSEPGVSLGVEILPPWWATAWFRAAAAATLGSVVWGLYRRRLHQVSLGIIAACDARLTERTRIAHDLHDTLLQTVQASKYAADSAVAHAHDQEYVRDMLGRVSEWLGQAVLEGRTVLNSLRESMAHTNDLSEDLRKATKDPFAPSTMSVTFAVEGRSRPLHPIVRDEIYAIVCEAMRNAFMHSQASRLDVTVKYARGVCVRVSDNGRGMDPDVTATGRVGHFGLQGMRERAARIGASLTIASTPGTGTEAMLDVPGHVMFKGPHSVRRRLLARVRILPVRRGA